MSKLIMLRTDSRLVRSLGATLTALPAYQSALADAPPAFTEVGLRYSHYSEDSLPEERVIFGSPSRYDIDVTQLWIEAPVGGAWSIALDVQNDAMSGASPWFVGLGLDGEPGVIMSGASIEDNRVEVGVTTRYFWADGNAGLAISHSEEDDYEALSFAFDVAWNSADNSRTWTASASSSNDNVSPVKERIPVFIDEESLNTQSMYFGVSQILSQTKIVRIGLSYTQSEGYLTDPYKFADRRPDTHDKWTLSAGYRQFMVNMDAALQADYRYYHDDWGTDSHTIEIGWHQNLGKHVLAPYLRYYTQGEADFFSPIADRSQPFYADDYRLSSYGALTAGVRWTVQFGDWGIEAQAERYRSNNDWSLFDGDAAPALVDFWRATVGLSWRFD
jgi:hypothetical protein